MPDKPKVVIVEDEGIIARDLRIQLQNFGFQVTGTASSASEAFASIEQERPDVVLMDIRIKGELDGISAAELVRTRYEIPVVYLTAHADQATLERAQVTEPFGYIVKPLGNTNIKAMLTMAVYKHRVERELNAHRNLLSAILQGLPEAVLVADASGEVLFLNQTAERLTGWIQQEAAGQPLRRVLALQDLAGRGLTEALLAQVLRNGDTAVTPSECVLAARNNRTFAVSGKLALASFGKRPAGVLITIHDVSERKREQQRLEQEQRMFVAGELARGAAREFYALFDVIDCVATDLSDRESSDDLETLRQAAEIGTRMSLHLLELAAVGGSARLTNVHERLHTALPLLRRVCGSGIKLSVDSRADAGFVLSTGDHFEQLLLHLVLDARQRLQGDGLLTLGAEPYANDALLRIAVRAEPAAAPQGEGAMFTLGTGTPEIGRTIVRAIVAASEGYTRSSELGDGSSLFEVFLPRQDDLCVHGHGVRRSQAKGLLLVGVNGSFLDAAKRAAGADTVILEAGSLEEAGLIAELYPGHLNLLIVNQSSFAAKAREVVCERICARRPEMLALPVTLLDEPSGAVPMSAGDLERVITQALATEVRHAIASAT